MEIIATIDQLSTHLNKLMHYDNDINSVKSYGHVNETNMVYVYCGIYNEYNVTQHGSIFTFEYVCGDRLLGNKILNRLKYMVENDGHLPVERMYATEINCEMEENFLKYLMDLDNHIFKPNGIEYITQLSTKLNDYLFHEYFRNTYVSKYEYIIYEKIEQFLRFNADNQYKIISLFHLINIIYFHCPLPEYKNLLSLYIQSSYPYVQKISNDMVLSME